MMLTYGYWQRRFGGDPSVIGQPSRSRASREVVGVMPAGFRILDADTDLIAPLQFDRSKLILPGFGFQGVAQTEAGPDLSRTPIPTSPAWCRSG